VSFNWLALLLEAALKGSLLIVAAGGAAYLCRKRSAAVRHHIWAAAALCMLALPLVSLLLPSWSAAVPAPALARSTPQARTPEANGLALPSMAVRAAASAVAMSAGSAARGVWFAGFVWGAGSLLIGSAYLAYRTRRSKLLLSRDWIRIAAELSAKYDLPRPARLLISPHRTMPLTWGVLRPRILLPPDAETWPEDRIRVVLAHELAHVRRRDWLTQMLGELGRTVYWFNPLMWICCDHLRQESEQACDDAVLLSGVQGPAYAEQLLGLAQALSSSERAWSVSLAMARQSHLERRFNAMLNSSTNRQGVTRSAGVLMTTAALCLLIPLASLRAPAQNMSGKFTGTVLDASGAAVPNATVIMSNTQARTKDMTTSGPAGSFEFETLNAGSYTLEVLKPGFARFSAPVQLEANHGQNHNVTLQLGVVQDRIDVVGEGRAKSAEASSAATPQRIKIGGDVQATKIIKMVRPSYPPAAKAAGITGAVLLEAVVSKEGEPLSLRVMNTQVDPDLARSAVESVSQWRYQPTLLNGEPVEIITQITVNYTLSQ
jgi:TonB family protein